MSTGFAYSLHLCSVSNLRIFLCFSYGILKLAFRARKLFVAFEGFSFLRDFFFCPLQVLLVSF